jgi:6-phosphogluconolactonase
MTFRTRSRLVVLLMVLAQAFAYAADKDYLFLVGTYTGKGSKGIYSYRFDPATGKTGLLGLAAETVNPSFLAVEPNGRYVYSVNELDTLDGKPTGGITAFQLDHTTGKLRFLQQVASLGMAPAHLSIDKSGRFVLVANYNSGNVAVFPIAEDGKLGPHTALEQQTGSSVNPKRQAGPHAHFVATDNDNRYALSADLGTDKVYVYRFNAQTGSLIPNEPPVAEVTPGSGPRHIAFSPSGTYAYLASEMGGTVTVFKYDTGTGVLTTKQTISSLPTDFKGDNREAEIAVDGRGRFLYVSNRGDATDDIVVFRINAADGTLSFVQRISSGGKIPRHFALDPSGKWLLAANHQSNNIQVFRVNEDTGRLTAASLITSIYDPVCIIFVPTGQPTQRPTPPENQH